MFWGEWRAGEWRIEKPIPRLAPVIGIVKGGMLLGWLWG